MPFGRADEQTTEALLDIIRKRFYTGNPGNFHRDRGMLLYAVTWPARWLDQRGLSTSPPAYRSIITQRLDEIRKHGDPQRYGSFFPNYLLKTLQQWFLHNGDDLYDQLKQIRNALFSAEAIIARLRTPHACDTCQQEREHIETLARAHRILRAQRASKRPRDHKQLELF